MDTMTLTASNTLSARRQQGAFSERPSGFPSHAALMAGLWLFIGLVGALDTYLTVKFRVVIPHMEQNPLGKLLLRLDGGDVSLFVGCKVAGMIIALGLLVAILTRARRTFAYAVLVPAALAQLIVLGYLLC
jgi:hypothetical protein